MRENNFVDRVVIYILRCSVDELKELTIQKITEHFDVSKVCLINKFKAEKGITPAKFILREKLVRSAFMMEKKRDLTVKEVAEKVGFSTSDYFIRVFKAHFGLPPCQYRDVKLEYNKEPPNSETKIL